jgi:hypothetical protein
MQRTPSMRRRHWLKDTAVQALVKVWIAGLVVEVVSLGLASRESVRQRYAGEAGKAIPVSGT